MLITILIIIALTYYGITNPTRTLIIYIIYSTRFLGFINIEFMVGEYEVSSFAINLLLLLLSLYNFQKNATSKSTICLITFIGIFTLFGIFWPVFINYSNYLQALKAGKAFFNYFVFFYIITCIHLINYKKVMHIIFLIGIYLSIVVWFYKFTNIAPPFYLTFKNETFLRIYYPTYISLAIFLLMFTIIEDKHLMIKNIILMLILCSALTMLGFFAISATTIGLIIVIILKNFNKFGKVFVLQLLITIIVLISYLHLNNYFEEQIIELVENQKIALLSRDNYNSFRWEIINENKFFGLGFLDRNVEILNESDANNENPYMSSLSFVDAGYIDLFGKFGLIGTCIFLFLPLFFIIKAIKHMKHGYILAFFILQYYFVNITWSVFSFPHGIIPLVLTYGYIYNQTILTKHQPNKKFQNNYL